MKLKIKDILPKEWKYGEDGKNIEIWYENKNKNPSSLIIKKQLEISEELGILMGFWAGDGGKQKFDLSNNNIQVLKKLNDIFLKNFGNVDLYVRVSIPINFKNNKNKILNEIKKIFPNSEIRRVNYYKEIRNAPSIKLCNDKVMTIKFIKLLFDYLYKNIRYNHIYWNGFLNGIIAAEGHMDLRKKYNTLSRISIAQINPLYREIIMKSLEKRKISYSYDEKYIKIFKKKNFEIIYNKRIFDFHPQKKYQFLKGYNNIKQEQYDCNLPDLLILKELKDPNRVSEISKRLNRCRQTIREHMQLKPNSLKEREFIEICGEERGKRGSFYGELWKLTDKGLEYLNENIKMVKE